MKRNKLITMIKGMQSPIIIFVNQIQLVNEIVERYRK